MREDLVMLDRTGLDAPAAVDPDGEDLTPFHAGERLHWRLAD